MILRHAHCGCTEKERQVEVMTGDGRIDARRHASARRKVPGSMNTQLTTNDKQADLREKRGRGLVAQGAVRRERDHYVIEPKSFQRSSKSKFEVRRDEQTGRVSCTCLEYEQEARTDSKFRCEHIYAVKHASPKIATNLNANSGSTKGNDIPLDEGVSAINSSDRDATRKRTEDMEARLNDDHRKPSPSDAVEGAISIPLDSETPEVERLPLCGTSSTPGDAHADFTEVLHTLRQPVDAKLVKTREGWTDRRGNKHTVEYVEWHTVADRLDRVCPAWSHSVMGLMQIGDVVAVTAAITIDGVTRMGLGTGAADNETGIKKAEHDALKRAAVKFGIARQLYQRESDATEVEKSDTGSLGANNSQVGDARQSDEKSSFTGFPKDPVAKGTADRVTPKQLGLINRSAREAGVNAEDECRRLVNCKVEDLSKRAASSLIDYLKDYPTSAGKVERRAR